MNIAPQTEAPLAERMRPRVLDDYVGQSHLVGPDATLRRAMTAGQLPSMILWGPPGVGKTTLARLMAEATGRPFHQLSAIRSGVKEVRVVIWTRIGKGGIRHEVGVTLRALDCITNRRKWCANRG